MLRVVVQTRAKDDGKKEKDLQNSLQTLKNSLEERMRQGEEKKEQIREEKIPTEVLITKEVPFRNYDLVKNKRAGLGKKGVRGNPKAQTPGHGASKGKARVFFTFKTVNLAVHLRPTWQGYCLSSDPGPALP